MKDHELRDMMQGEEKQIIYNDKRFQTTLFFLHDERLKIPRKHTTTPLNQPYI